MRTFHRSAGWRGAPAGGDMEAGAMGSGTGRGGSIARAATRAMVDADMGTVGVTGIGGAMTGG